MNEMAALNPEVQKIQKKHSDDPQKAQVEIQALYAKHKVNPLGGCLPMIIQLPIFMALNYIMQSSAVYIKRLGGVYDALAAGVMSVPDYVANIKDLAWPHVPKGMTIDLAVKGDLLKVLYKFTQDDWTALFSRLPAQASGSLAPFFAQKEGVEHFFGIDLLANGSLSFPAVLLPVLAALFTFLSSWLAMKLNGTRAMDDAMKNQQRVMMIMMPVFIGWMCLSFSAGVGVYWVASNMFQLIQQIALNKIFAKKEQA
jgi:YidC/Oxa1 family membrane protein insertase